MRSGRARARSAVGDLRRDVAVALPAWITARVVVALTVLVARGFAQRLHPPSPGVRRHVDQALLGWDAERYHDIAELGYAALPPSELRFFPLFPLAGRGVGWLLGGRSDLGLLLVANVSALLAGALLVRLVRRETGDEGAARRATWLFALAPPAFVMAWGYSEPLAAVLALGAFLTARRRAWWAAAAFGVLAGLTRPLGVVLALPVAVEVLADARRGRGRRAWLGRVAATAAPVAGCGAYLAWVGWRFGDALLPLRVQQTDRFRGDVTDPVGTVLRAAGDLLAGTSSGNALHVPFAVVAVALAVVAARRLPASYAAYAAVVVVLALSTERLGSFERYVWSTFPVAVAAAVASRRGDVHTAILATSAAACAVLGTAALLGGYVP